MHHLYTVQSGLDKLAEAAGTVDELSQQAEAQRSLLATKQEEADMAMTHIQVIERYPGLWRCAEVASGPVLSLL